MEAYFYLYHNAKALYRYLHRALMQGTTVVHYVNQAYTYPVVRTREFSPFSRNANSLQLQFVRIEPQHRAKLM